MGGLKIVVLMLKVIKFLLEVRVVFMMEFIFIVIDVNVLLYSFMNESNLFSCLVFYVWWRMFFMIRVMKLMMNMIKGEINV